MNQGRLPVDARHREHAQMWLELLREDCEVAPTDTLLMEKEAGELMAVITTMINGTKGIS